MFQTYDTPLSFPEDDNVDLMQISPVGDLNPYCSSYGAFSPVFEDPSPDTHLDYDHGSSPIGPLTPFGDFIDRAMAKDDLDYPGNMRQPFDCYQDHRYGAPQHQKQSYTQAEPSPAAVTTSAPSASIDYKKLVDPLSDWLAAYVWRVCTTGAGLPHPFFRSSSVVSTLFLSSVSNVFPVPIPSDIQECLSIIWRVLSAPCSFPLFCSRPQSFCRFGTSCDCLCSWDLSLLVPTT
jgi:hypothetical protein